MADLKISQLTAITTLTPATDVLPVVDVTGTTKKITTNQILGSGGTATLASATISGDLTVDTSTLKVDSANNRVGIGTAIPAVGFDVGYTESVFGSSTSSGYSILNLIGTGTGSARYGSIRKNYDSPFDLRIRASNSNSDAPIIFELSNASTAMTLNSTGLGIGASPTQKLHVKGVVNFEQVSGGTNGWQAYTYTDGTYRMNYNGAGADELIIDTSGNVGISVQPSAWASGYKVIQGQAGGFALSNDNSSNNQFRLSSNAYFDTTDNRWEYYGTSTATAYEQRVGEHRFFNAPSGTVNTAITFTQAMTLDASGNLLVGTTSATVNNNGYRVVNDGNTNSARLELGSASSTNSNIGLSMYSTGAAAYRFYVGWGGTIFATNTTISAISDQRLKENIQDIDVGLGAILALKPRKFDWKAGKGKDIKGDRGFIAQEFEQVFPNLIDEWKDAAPEGEAPYKSVRQDLIPVLVKAIQELAAEVNALKNA